MDWVRSLEMAKSSSESDDGAGESSVRAADQAARRFQVGMKTKTWNFKDLGLGLRELVKAVDRFPLLKAQRTTVEKMDLSGNPIAAWPWSGPVPFPSLPNCRELVLDSTRITVLPASVKASDLPELRALSLARVPLSTLVGSWLDPAAPTSPPPHRLQRLVVGHVEALPPPPPTNAGPPTPPPPESSKWISDAFGYSGGELYAELTTLTFQSVPLRAVPPGLGAVRSLTSVSFINCDLKEFPEQMLKAWRGLKTLNLGRNPALASLPDSWLPVAESLTTLNVSDCVGLSWLPMGLHACSQLDQLSYSGIRLKDSSDFPRTAVHQGRMLTSVPRFVDHRREADEELAALGMVSPLSTPPVSPRSDGPAPAPSRPVRMDPDDVDEPSWMAGAVVTASTTPPPPIPPVAAMEALTLHDNLGGNDGEEDDGSGDEDGEEDSDPLYVTGRPSRVLRAAAKACQAVPSLKVITANSLLGTLGRKRETVRSLGAIPDALVRMLTENHACECPDCGGRVCFVGPVARGVVFMKLERGLNAYHLRDLGVRGGVRYQTAKPPLSVVLNPAHAMKFLRLGEQ